MMITDTGNVIRIKAKEVSVLGRNTQGVRLIKVAEGSIVSSVEVVDKSEEETEDNEEE